MVSLLLNFHTDSPIYPVHTFCPVRPVCPVHPVRTFRPVRPDRQCLSVPISEVYMHRTRYKLPRY